MTGNVVRLHSTEAEVNAAWEAYDAASRKVAALILDPASTRAQRWQATLEAERLRTEFRRLYDRWPS